MGRKNPAMIKAAKEWVSKSENTVYGKSNKKAYRETKTYALVPTEDVSKIIETKFDGKCAVCGQKILKGTQVLWERKVGQKSKISHTTCPVQTLVPNRIQTLVPNRVYAQSELEDYDIALADEVKAEMLDMVYENVDSMSDKEFAEAQAEEDNIEEVFLLQRLDHQHYVNNAPAGGGDRVGMVVHFKEGISVRDAKLLMVDHVDKIDRISVREYHSGTLASAPDWFEDYESTH